MERKVKKPGLLRRAKSSLVSAKREKYQKAREEKDPSKRLSTSCDSFVNIASLEVHQNAFNSVINEMKTKHFNTNKNGSPVEIRKKWGNPSTSSRATIAVPSKVTNNEKNFYQGRFSPQNEFKFPNEQFNKSNPQKTNDPILQSISTSERNLSTKTSLTSSVFEKCTKVSIDGKTTKLSKNEKTQVENNNLLIVDDKGNVKQILIPNLDQFTKEDRNPKEFILRSNTSVIKVYKEAPIAERRNFLQKFFPRRTTKEDLVRKGIYKNEPIFGNTLTYLAEKYHRPVPEIVTKIIELVELPKNIVSQGVYRASGNGATIQKIRLKVDSYKFTVLDDYKNDVDVLAGALKMFFRELKESLIGKKEYYRLVKILDYPAEEQYRAVGEVMNSLTPPHKETLKAVLEHLLKIAEQEDKNHMSINALAICWAQSIICFEDTSINNDNLLEVATNKNAIFTLLLNTYKSTFVSSLKPAVSSK